MIQICSLFEANNWFNSSGPTLISRGEVPTDAESYFESWLLGSPVLVIKARLRPVAVGSVSPVLVDMHMAGQARPLD